MTEERFRELLNLYLDQEISPEEKKLLFQEIDRDEDRREAFEAECRFHKAMLSALRASEPVAAESAGTAHEKAGLPILFPLAYVAGMAACVTVIFAVFAQQMDDSNSSYVTTTTLATEEAEPTEYEISRAELLRHLERQKRLRQHQATLAAQLRLMGMSPEILPEGRRLATVDPRTLDQRTGSENDSQRLQRLAELSPLPETPIIQYRPASYTSSSSGSTWPSGFKTSLASFK